MIQQRGGTDSHATVRTLGIPFTYCDLHFNCVWGEVDRDWQHRPRHHGDTPGKEEEEDQTAKKETHHHGDAHVQLPANAIQTCKIVHIKWHGATITDISVCMCKMLHTQTVYIKKSVCVQLYLNSTNADIVFLWILCKPYIPYVRLGFSLTSLHGITATSWSCWPVNTERTDGHNGPHARDRYVLMWHIRVI